MRWSFNCDIWMGGEKFGISKMKVYIHLVTIVHTVGVGVMLWVIFSSYGTNKRSFKCHNLPK